LTNKVALLYVIFQIGRALKGKLIIKNLDAAKQSCGSGMLPQLHKDNIARIRNVRKFQQQKVAGYGIQDPVNIHPDPDPGYRG
jgi:hypothetical protein